MSTQVTQVLATVTKLDGLMQNNKGSLLPASSQHQQPSVFSSIVERLCRHVLATSSLTALGFGLSILLAVSSLSELTYRDLFSSRVFGIAMTT